MRTLTKEITLYTFAELSDAAKDRARDWFRQGIDFDPEYVLDDAATVGAMLGITIDRPRGRRSGYAVDWDTNPIGAAFVGSWRASDLKPGAAVRHAPQDADIARIAADLERIAAAFPEAYADCGTGRGCFQRVGAWTGGDEYSDPDADAAAGSIVEALQSFAHWIGCDVARDYEWTYSDESVDESIEANEYEFTADGEVYS